MDTKTEQMLFKGAAEIKTGLAEIDRLLSHLIRLEDEINKTARMDALITVTGNIRRSIKLMDSMYYIPDDPVRIPEEHELTEEQKKRGGFWNKDGFYVFRGQDVGDDPNEMIEVPPPANRFEHKSPNEIIETALAALQEMKVRYQIESLF